MATDNSSGRALAPRDCCVFTIVSRNYFHFARNLMASVAEQMPGTRRVIVVCDATEGLDAPDGVELLGIDELALPHADRVVLHYTILELNTAIKPFAFARLFEGGAQAVVYFDPDIQLYSSGRPLLDRLAASDVVLTPHLTAPLADERHPSDLSILQSGTYNLGFLALRRSEAAQVLLQWWSGKLLRDCVVDIPRGLFTDQKWMDLVPGFFEQVAIERDPGWNVAYWNLAHRDVQHGTQGFTVNGRPLFFFHFSGRDPRSASISKHQDRFTLDDCTPATRRLMSEYEASLLAQGRERYARLPYAFARLADGTPLPDIARQVLRLQLDWSRPMPRLDSPEGARFVAEFLAQPVDRAQPPLSRLAMHLYRSRPDLQAAFPDVQGVHRQAFLGWFAERAGPEAGIEGVLAGAAPARTVPVPETAPAAAPEAGAGPEAATPDRAPAQAAAPAPTPVPVPASTPVRNPAWHFRLAYRLAWKMRRLVRPVLSLAVRQRVHAALMRRAFPPQPALPMAPAADPAALPWGLTVIGYVQAESGVGESARSTLRALSRTSLPHSLVDFRVGNVSRMDEQVDTRVEREVRHAISLFHVNADQMPVARAHLDARWFEVPVRIGFWAWELENFPPQWQESFAHVDEVWVPSSFCQAAVAAVSPVPVLCMPHSVEIPERLAPDRARFGLREDSVVFLAMADTMSSVERKNPFGALQAFLAAFPAQDRRAEIVVKISNGDRNPEALAQLQAMAATHPGVHLIGDYLSRPDLNTLLDSVDAYVSLHRSEGFGLGIAEAMARGKVVVATGWSGNMDFMNAHNSLPVDYELRALEADAGPYRRGERWAEPRMDDAVRKMQQLVADAELRERLGARAQAHCRLHLAPEVVGRRIEQRVQALRARVQGAVASA